MHARVEGVRVTWQSAGRLLARMAHTKGWGASAVLKSDVSGTQVLSVRWVGTETKFQRRIKTAPLCTLQTHLLHLKMQPFKVLVLLMAYT